MSFFRTLQDEALRVEVGAGVLKDLAVENIELSGLELSQAVRKSVIERRVVPPAIRRPDANRLAMQEVRLPRTVVEAPVRRAA